MCKKTFRLSFSVAILFMIFSFSNIQAQVPNSGFEKWTKGTPSGWWTNNKSVLHFTPVNKTTESHSGKYAVDGKVEFLGKAMPAAPVIHTGNAKNSEFKISKNYKSLSGFYMLNSVKGDQFVASVTMYKDGKTIGKGIKYFPASKKFSRFKVPVNYTAKGLPGKCEIMFTVYPGFGGTNQMMVHKGTEMSVDDVSLTN